MKLYNIIALGAIIALNGRCNAISSEGLDWANANTEYLTRETMRSLMEDTVKYITEFNKYVNSVESKKFSERANLSYDTFMKCYEEFRDEAVQLESDYKMMILDPGDKDKRKRFNDQMRKVDDSFTKATKQYTETFRRINRSLTKLDKEKIMYTDAEIFKRYSSITIRSTNHMVTVEKMIEIIRGRADECGPVTKKEDYYTDTLEALKQSHSEMEKIYDNYPLYIIKEEEFDKLNKDYDEVLKKFDNSVENLKKFENSLGQKYKDNQIKYDKRFQRCIKMIQKLPFRISAFWMPNILSTLLLTLIVITRM